MGGWGGSLVGISSLDGMDASENETTKFVSFETGRWYRIRLRVTEKKIQAWIDKEKLVDVDTAEQKISVRPGDIEMSKPFGLAAWQTTRRRCARSSSGEVSGPAGKGDTRGFTIYDIRFTSEWRQGAGDSPARDMCR